MDESDFGDLLLKTLMCKLENLTPFWEVHPFEACKCLLVSVGVYGRCLVRTLMLGARRESVR